MELKKEIQIFVSCPGDIQEEIKLVETACKTVNETHRINCNLIFTVKEWSSIVGQVGERPQGIINRIFANYDIYLGIWHKRFGSNTGKIDTNTNNDYGSGSKEEFELAFANWQVYQYPEIYLFFKKFASVDDDEIDQMKLVKDFKLEQKKNNWVNEFKENTDFLNKIFNLLLQKANKICDKDKIDEKQATLSDNNFIKYEQYKIKLASSVNHIERTFINYSSLKSQTNSALYDYKTETLDSIINNNNRIIILGDAGSGKTTELKNLANKLINDESPYIVILQYFRDYTPEKGLELFLPIFWKNIPANLGILVWDGLDEIQPQHFNTVVRQINSFSAKYPDIKIVISCRTNFYELPVNNLAGTLNDFEAFFITDFQIDDVKRYYSITFNKNEGEVNNFIEQIRSDGMGDLIGKPFSLMLLSEYYKKSKGKHLRHSELFDSFIESRIIFDQIHFKSTKDLRSKRNEIITLLKKIAIAMEIVAKSVINESDLLKIINSDEFTLLKFCSAFTKVEGEDNIWRFEHNNIQEYLAAIALSILDFEKIKAFITFEPDNKKLNPSWVNTLTFLISILGPKDKLITELIDWMVINEKEIVIKFEKEKIPENTRNDIFKSIFNYYKENGIWLWSNKFTEIELAKFGQSGASIKFILEQVKDESNSTIVIINAIQILGHFQIENQTTKDEITALLLGLIFKYNNETLLIQESIYALKWAKLCTTDVLESLMNKLGHRKNEHIRSALYHVILDTKTADTYVDYLISGYEIINNRDTEDRSDILLSDENYFLEECILTIKSPKSLKKLLTYIGKKGNYEYEIRIKDILLKIIENAIIAYKTDTSIYNTVFNLTRKIIEDFIYENVDEIIAFFDATETRQNAFLEALEIYKKSKKENSTLLAKLLNIDLFEIIIKEYNEHELTNTDLDTIFFDLSWVKNPDLEYYNKIIAQKTSYRKKDINHLDYKTIRSERLLSDFNLLFKPESFEKEVLKIFIKYNANEFSNDQVRQIWISSEKLLDEAIGLSSRATRFLLDFKSFGKITITNVKSWFENKSEVAIYCIGEMFHYLLMNKFQELDSNKKGWLKKWANKIEKNIDFKSSIINNNGRASTDVYASFLALIVKYFDVQVSQETLINMLLFDFYDNNEWSGIKYLIEKLPKNELDSAIIKNIEDGIEPYQVLRNHVDYATKHKLIITYPYILKEIVNINRDIHARQNLLSIYFKQTEDLEGIKSILSIADNQIKWQIVEILFKAPSHQFLTKYLLGCLEFEKELNEKLIAANYLIKLQNIEGLIFIGNWLIKQESNIDLSYLSCFDFIRNKEAISYLMELLDLSYRINLEINSFRNLKTIVTDALINVAFENQENFNEITRLFKDFIEINKNKYDDVNYLLPTIERMETQFYLNKAQSYTIEQAMVKINTFI